MPPPLATPTDFETVRMTSEMGNTILRHVFRWKSSTRSMGDLAKVFTRESVEWGSWPAPLTACIGPDHAAYRKPGKHSGLATNPANLGQGQDDHALLGPFNQTILAYKGAPASAPMDQVYEYSHDRSTWHPIPNGAYSIVRTVQSLGDGRVQITITKTSRTKPGDKLEVKKVF
jgi:hypothetical protein